MYHNEKLQSIMYISQTQKSYYHNLSQIIIIHCKTITKISTIKRKKDSQKWRGNVRFLRRIVSRDQWLKAALDV